jgi:(p)ppGpp synthase/HD superfamily hydrolase
MNSLKQIYYQILIEQRVSDLEKAEQIALQTHFWQFRKSGQSYLNHLMRIVRRCKALGYNEYIQVIALLHDTLEDSKFPQKTRELIKKNFTNGNEILRQIEYLTRDYNTDYNEFVLNIWKKSPNVAFKIKMLDMLDNLIDNPEPAQEQKYRESILNLLNNKVPIDLIPKQILNKLQIHKGI